MSCCRFVFISCLYSSVLREIYFNVEIDQVWMNLYICLYL